MVSQADTLKGKFAQAAKRIDCVATHQTYCMLYLSDVSLKLLCAVSDRAMLLE